MKRLYLSAVLFLFMFVIISGCSNVQFSGNSIKNPAEFTMNYSVLNRTETHEMQLKEGAKVGVVIEDKSGRLDILVTGPDGQKIYKADDAASGNFSIIIPKSGTYKFSVKGSKAKGSVSFKAVQ